MTRLPTSFLLGGPAGWPTGAVADVGVGAATLMLAADPGGPRGLGSADDSLGGLTVPRLVASGQDDTVLLLDPKRARVLRLGCGRTAFDVLPHVGGEGADPRRLRRPSALAVAGDDLFVADRGNRRVQVFDLRSLTLVRIWQRSGWDPADVVAGPRAVYVLDAAHGRVHRYDLGGDALVPVIDVPSAATRWSRLAVDRAGRIYALDRAAGAVDVFNPAGRPLGPVRDPGDVRDRFDPPAVRCDGHGRLVVSGLLFDSAGRRVTPPPDEAAGPPAYTRHGRWTSIALDSEIDRCQWHRLELRVDALPAGTSIAVSTHSATDETAEPPADGWTTDHVLTGSVEAPGPAKPRDDEFLVQSRPGRLLRVRIELRGDGYATPVVAALRVHFPRQSYLEYLPAVFAADDDSRWFLERFLSVMQTEWDAITEETRTVDRLFGAASAPAGPFLRYLCSWLALPAEPTWDDDQLRRALLAAREVYPRRGTARAIRAWLTVCLENLTGHRPAADGFPHLLEGFEQRRWLAFAGDGPARLGTGAPLWGPAVVGRLQLDVFAREGEVRLVSTGDPERDVYHEFAHRFSVFIPASWVRTAGDEAVVRRALDAERPAHSAYELCLVEPRTRVGVQSTVGVDTIVGARPAARLTCPHDTGGAPSRGPVHRLGYDMVLAAATPHGPGARVRPPRDNNPDQPEPRSHRD